MPNVSENALRLSWSLTTRELYTAWGEAASRLPSENLIRGSNTRALMRDLETAIRVRVHERTLHAFTVAGLRMPARFITDPEASPSGLAA